MAHAKIDNKELARTVIRHPVHWLAFGFGFGLAPFAPGTWGSLPGIAIWWLLPKDFGVQLVVIAAMLVAGIWICGESARRIGVHDHGGIVWDEIVGMLLTLTVIPDDPVWVIAAFIAFRVADIWKPWPIRELDHRLHGGLGIMLDDVMAAVYAALILLFLQRILL